MLRVFEAFAGYGSQSIALRNLGIEYEVVAISEIDKYAIKAYEAIHGPTNNLGDICKIDPNDIPDHDLFTYSFPCQDLSVAGKQAGLGEGTRSGLLYECKKVIEAKRPKYLLLENVKNLVGKKFKAEFDKWLEYLEELGYTNYWQVLNAKDYGVPQNRERVFVVSILGEHKPYKFANKMPLDKCIADILENEVDEKYYLSEEIQKRFKITNQNKNIIGTTKPDFRTIGQRDVVYDKNGIMGALVATDYKQPKQIAELNQVGTIDIKGMDCIKRVYGTDGISPALTTMQGGNRQPKIICEGNINPSGKGMNGNVFNSRGISPTLTTNKGEGQKIIIDTLDFVGGIGDKDWVGDNKKLSRNYPQGNRVYSDKGIACSQTSNGGGLGGSTGLYLTNYRIRKLTPRECFRLMGMRDDDIDKIQATGLSNTQQYKMAGNSIVVNVLEAIFKELFL